MHSTLRAVLSLTLTLALPLLCVHAQQSSTITGGLSGAVTDSTGALIPGATVTVAGPQGTRVVTTDQGGHYSISRLVPGFYTVSVVKTGFKKSVSTQDEVVVNILSTLNIRLEAGGSTESVEVTAS